LLLSPSFVVGASWACVAVLFVRHGLRARALAAWAPPPPLTGPGAARGVQAVIHRLEPTCLERALVLQRWLAASGDRRDVVIGVRRDVPDGFAAHAWLVGEALGADGYVELERLPVAAATGGRPRR
jgi:hypothetical protein